MQQSLLKNYEVQYILPLVEVPWVHFLKLQQKLLYTGHDQHLFSVTKSILGSFAVSHVNSIAHQSDLKYNFYTNKCYLPKEEKFPTAKIASSFINDCSSLSRGARSLVSLDSTRNP